MNTTTVQEKVAEGIKGCGSKVEQIVIDTLVGNEVTKRQDVIIKALGRLDTLKKELNKINRPDSVTYVDGKKHESMTETRFKEIEKANETINKLQAATDKALEENTADAYAKLTELVNKSGDKSSGDKA